MDSVEDGRPARRPRLERRACAAFALGVVVAGGVVVADRLGEQSTSLAESGAAFSMPTYESVDELARASNAVVLGTVLDSGTASVDHGVDGGHDVPGAPVSAIPVRVFRFRVDSVVASRPKMDGVIDVVLPRSPGQGVSEFVKGEHLALFLLHFPKTGVEGLTGAAWAPLSYDNATFVLAGDSASAKSGAITALHKRGSGKSDPNSTHMENGRLSVSVADLTAAVKDIGVGDN